MPTFVESPIAMERRRGHIQRGVHCVRLPRSTGRCTTGPNELYRYEVGGFSSSSDNTNQSRQCLRTQTKHQPTPAEALPQGAALQADSNPDRRRAEVRAPAVVTQRALCAMNTRAPRRIAARGRTRRSSLGTVEFAEWMTVRSSLSCHYVCEQPGRT